MNRPWLDHYDDGVPASLTYPAGTLVDVLRATAAERPAHPALHFKGSTVSYGDLDRLRTAFAASLAADGVRKGDRVGLLLPNCPQFLIAQSLANASNVASAATDSASEAPITSRVGSGAPSSTMRPMRLG